MLLVEVDAGYFDLHPLNSCDMSGELVRRDFMYLIKTKTVVYCILKIIKFLDLEPIVC